MAVNKGHFTALDASCPSGAQKQGQTCTSPNQRGADEVWAIAAPPPRL